MPNIDDIIKSLKSLLEFTGAHPYLSIPIVAIVLAMTLASLGKSFREQLGWIADIITSGTRRQRFILVVAVACIAVVAIASPFVVLHHRRPKPIFLQTKAVVLSREFNARWSYSDDRNGNIKYHLVAESSDAHEEAFTTIPYHRVGLTGRVKLQVTAINKDGSERASDPLFIEIYRDSIQRLKATGQLLVGIHADDNPGVFCFNSPDAGYQGFDIDISREIAKRVSAKYGVQYREPEFLFYHWPELLSEPNTYDVDFIIASISKTTEREEKYALRFSSPYYTTELGLVQKNGPTTKIIYTDLLKLSLAANSTTTAAKFADSLRLHTTMAPTKQEVFALLADGKVNGILYDYIRSFPEASSRQWISRQIDYTSIPAQLRPPAEEYSVATAALNDTLLSEINAVIAAVDTKGMINGRIQELSQNKIHH
jgi:ABC-type amino acid transport substrate-binding protein